MDEDSHGPCCCTFHSSSLVMWSVLLAELMVWCVERVVQIINRMLEEYGKGQGSVEGSTLLQLMIQATEGEAGWTTDELLAQCVTCKRSPYLIYVRKTPVHHVPWPSFQPLTLRPALCLCHFDYLCPCPWTGVAPGTLQS
jgi:hypothetical protein